MRQFETMNGGRVVSAQRPVCNICGKRYLSRLALQRHQLHCTLLLDAKTPDLRDNDAPSAPRLYAMLVDLAARHQRLTLRFERLLSKQPTKRRRIGLCEWLERTCPRGQAWEDWRDKLQVGRSELELVFQVGHKQGVGEILERALPPGGEGESPLRSFVQQPSTLFVRCRKDGWRPATPEDLTLLVGIVVKALTRELGAWTRDATSGRLVRNSSSTMAEELTKHVRRALGTDHAPAEVVAHVRATLCRHLRAEACTLVECEVPSGVPRVGDGE